METFVAVILSFQGFLFSVEMHWLKFVKAKFAEETAASWRYRHFFEISEIWGETGLIFAISLENILL